jgi:hypothetical protein
VKDVFEKLKKMANQADEIYDQLLEKDSGKKVITVESMIGKIPSKNIIQDQCI